MKVNFNSSFDPYRYIQELDSAVVQSEEKKVSTEAVEEQDVNKAIADCRRRFQENFSLLYQKICSLSLE